MEPSALIGTWRLVGCVAETTSGDALYPYGTAPQGQLMYDAHGNMSVHLLAAQRAHFAAADKFQGTPEECRHAFTSYEAYYGTYVVDAQQAIVTHRLEGALFPNWSGREHQRHFRLDGARLELRTPPMQYAGGETVTVTIEFERHE